MVSKFVVVVCILAIVGLVKVSDVEGIVDWGSCAINRSSARCPSDMAFETGETEICDHADALNNKGIRKRCATTKAEARNASK